MERGARPGIRAGRRASWIPLAVALGGLGPWGARPATAQVPPSRPARSPLAPAPAASSGGPRREAELEARIRLLEASIRSAPDAERVRQLEERLRTLPDPEQVRQMEATVRRLSSQVQQLTTRLAESETRGAGPSPRASGGGGPAAAAGAAMGPGADASDAGVGEEVVGGAAGISPAAPPPSPRFEMPEPIPDLRLRARFGPGFELKTADDEFNLQFHNLTQLDGRFYEQGGQNPVADSFTIPRQWFIFSGHLTKPYEYYVSIAQGFDSFSVLDVFLNVNYNKALQFRVGRFKSPFTYEFYAEPVQGLPNGEWSLFFNNFGYNRDLGAMAWGEAFDDRLDYAAGIFNGDRNGLLDLADPKEFIGFLNLSPFATAKDSPLENFNIGGSVVAGDLRQVPVPKEMRTIVPTAGNLALGVPFLNLNDNMLASGAQAFWSLHAAYYYRQLSLIAEWQSGFEDYAQAGRATRTRVPVESFYVQAAYLLTGERVASRGMVKPLRPFDLRKGKFGLGAWEIAGRYNALDLGNDVFTAGLADPNLWTNRLYTTDLGLSWYWNQYIRVLFDWQHAEFANPVLYRPGGFQKTSDLFLVRFQVWF